MARAQQILLRISESAALRRDHAPRLPPFCCRSRCWPRACPLNNKPFSKGRRARCAETADRRRGAGVSSVLGSSRTNHRPSQPSLIPPVPSPLLAQSRSPVATPQPTRGRSSAPPRPSSRQPSVRPSSAAPAAPSYSYGATPAPAAGGLSAEQAEFMARKARESRSPAPVEVRRAVWAGVAGGGAGCKRAVQGAMHMWQPKKETLQLSSLVQCN